MKKILLLSLFFNLIFSAYGQQNQMWTNVSSNSFTPFEKLDKKFTPKTYQLYTLDMDLLKSKLATAPARATNKTNPGIVVAFPTPSGTLQNFRVYEASVLHPELAARYTDIKSYVGVGVDNPALSIRFSTTIFGLHTMMFTAGESTSYIDPYTTDRKTYIVFSRKDVDAPRNFICGNNDVAKENDGHNLRSTNAVQSNTGIFRTYRLAISSTIEYSTFHIQQAGVSSGTTAQKKAAVLAAMVVTMTRVNGLYERDLSITMEIVPNNDVLISLNSNDGFSNEDGPTLLGQNQSAVNSLIGSANYDIGHIFSTGGGGIASLGSVCDSSAKAQGVTGSPAPVGDFYDIDYVAHEMGHQFGATHTFNGLGENCTNGTRSPSTAVEPGSGTTIMAYAGICNPVNVQGNSDDHFASTSILDIEEQVAGNSSCSVNVENTNTAPVITPLKNYSIPKSTPFLLRGKATDAEGDALTYCWEQIDNEISTQPPVATATNGPNFRSREPNTSPNRSFPIVNNVISNNLAPTWEVIPSVARTMDFSLTVRDNNILNGGQTNRDDLAITFVNVGPFLVTYPNTSGTSLVAGTNQTVTWDIGGTTANGINTPFVDIYLSTNSGGVASILLASKVPNDGSEIITLPATTGNANRIIIYGHDNVFYDMSNSNFVATAAASSFSIGPDGIEGGQNKTACVGSNVVYSINYTAIAGFSGSTTLSATGNPPGTTVTFSPNPVTASGPVTMTVTNTDGASEGFYTISVTATSGAVTRNSNFYLQLEEALFQPIVLLTPANAATGQAVDTNLTWTEDIFAESYDVQVATDSGFANIVFSGNTTTNSITASGLTNLTTYYWRVRSRNIACESAFTATSQYTTRHCASYASANVPLTISEGVASVTNSTLTIPSNANTTITDIDITLDITHSWIRDLNVRLISPTGTQITVFAAICSTTVEGFQDADATFDDSAPDAVSCGPSNPRISGRVRPSQALSAFNGQSSQGVWTLRVSDGVTGDGGAINSWSLNICGATAPLAVETEERFSFSVFPNPSNGSFTVKSDKILSGKTKIQVYDMRGRVIFENDYSENTLNENIQLQNAQAGIYLLSVSDGDSKEVKRIIIE